MYDKNYVLLWINVHGNFNTDAAYENVARSFNSQLETSVRHLYSFLFFVSFTTKFRKSRFSRPQIGSLTGEENSEAIRSLVLLM